MSPTLHWRLAAAITIRDSPLAADEKLLLYTLLTYANDAELVSYPLQSTIANRMGRSERRVRALVAALRAPTTERDAVVLVQTLRGGRKCYRIELAALRPDCDTSTRAELDDAGQIVAAYHRSRWNDRDHAATANELTAARKLIEDDGYALAEVLAVIPRAARRMRDEIQFSGLRLFQHASTFVREQLEKSTRGAIAAAGAEEKAARDRERDARESESKRAQLAAQLAAMDGPAREALRNKLPDFMQAALALASSPLPNGGEDGPLPNGGNE